jgi:hypothetical protein
MNNESRFPYLPHEKRAVPGHSSFYLTLTVCRFSILKSSALAAFSPVLTLGKELEKEEVVACVNMQQPLLIIALLGKKF